MSRDHLWKIGRGACQASDARVEPWQQLERPSCMALVQTVRLRNVKVHGTGDDHAAVCANDLSIFAGEVAN